MEAINMKTLNGYKNKLAAYLSALENLNAEICKTLNEMLVNDNYKDIEDDVQYTLDNNFCNSENLLHGLLEACEESQSDSDNEETGERQYAVKITEMVVTVEAENEDEAVAIVEDCYNNSGYILDTDSFVGVTFEVIENNI